ncbi:hypothetical protein ABPG72_001120 [Tetrahymena utriculariae]
MTATVVSGSDGVTPQSAQCSPCPANTGNINGSSTAGDISLCNLCSQNYHMTQVAIPNQNGVNPSAAQCLSCPAGSGNDQPPSSSGDISQCNIYQINYYITQVAVTVSSENTPSAAVCTICPTGQGNSTWPNSPGDIFQCYQCQAGFYMAKLAVQASNGVNLTSALCNPCPANSTSQPTSTISTISSCQCFDPNAAPINSSQTSCICANGYFGVPNTSQNQVSGCFSCDINQYSTQGAACTTCAMGSLINPDFGGYKCIDTSIGTLPWNEQQEIAYACKEGYYGINAEIGGSCIQYPTGTNITEPSNYAKGNTNSLANISVCNQCSLNFYMNAAASTSQPIASAQCTAYFTGSGAQIPSKTPTDISFCSICVPNYYVTVAAFNPIPGVKAFPAICIPCPANSSSPLQTQTGALVNCTCYDVNALPFQATQTTCTCLNCYYGNISSVQGGPSGCTHCPPGMFQEELHAKNVLLDLKF